MRGDVESLLRLAPRLQSPDLHIEEVDGEVYLLSSLFETLSTREEVFALAQDLVPALRGAMRIAGVREREPIHPQAVFERKEDGTETNTQFIVIPTLVVHAEVFAPTILINGVAAQPAPLRAELALRSTAVRTVLALCAGEPSFVNLYRITEMVIDDVGGQAALDGLGWVPRAERRRFFQTANSLDAVGMEARHGTRSVPSPATPMTLEEATELVHSLVEHWLDSKGAAYNREHSSGRCT